MPLSTKALEGVRVIELCKSIAGPYTASLLGDMGADVIKVEVPGQGDDFRTAAPVVNGESYYFMLANRSKRSITLDLKTEEGKRIFLKLVESSDVMIQNFRPGTVERLGVDYATLKRVNPRLVFCSISGFGLDGPYRDWAAYDLVLQAMGGIMSVTGQRDGDPTSVGVPVVDVMTALFSAYGILSALIARGRTGEGQHIDTSLFDSSIAPLMQLAGMYFATGRVPGPGYKQDALVPYGLFKARNGSFVVEAGNYETWRRLCLATGMDDFAEDHRFSTGVGRAENREQIVTRLEKVFKEKDAEEWLEILRKNGVPAGPVQNMKQVFNDPHTLHRKMVTEVNHPKLGPIKLVGIPVKMSSTPPSISIPPPLLGQHTEEILSELGYGKAQFEDLRRRGIV